MDCQCSELHLFVVSNLLKKYYNALLKSFPADLDYTIRKIDDFHMTANTYPYGYFKQAPDISSANQRILDSFLIIWSKANSAKGLLTFMSIMITIIGNSAVTRNLSKGKSHV